LSDNASKTLSREARKSRSWGNLKKSKTWSKLKMRKMVGIGVFFFILLVVLIMSPQVTTANTAAYDTWAAASENASMLMMGTIMPWGAALIIISILVTMGMTTLQATNKFSMEALVSPLVRIVFSIVLLTFFSQIITAINTNLAGETNAIVTIFWGIIPGATYILMIGVCGGWDIVEHFRKGGKNKKASKGALGYAGGGV
jgi:hypothetical protein